MAAEQSKPQGPDLAQGVPLSDVADGSMIGGHVGDEAVRRWVRRHWPGFRRARWLEHLAGERFWVELDRADFGRLAQVPADQRLLLSEIVERMRHGDENLDIVRWARREKTPAEQKVILELHLFIHARPSPFGL